MWVSLLLWVGLAVQSEGHCPSSVLGSLPFVLEYAVWRGWYQAVIYTPLQEPGELCTLSTNCKWAHLSTECKWALVRLVKCMGVNGVAASVYTDRTRVRLRNNLGMVVAAPTLTDNTTEHLAKLLKQLSEIEMNTASYDWLITGRTEHDFRLVNKLLNVTSIRFDQNIVVSYPLKAGTRDLGVCDHNFKYSSNQRSSGGRTGCRYRNDPTCSKEHEINYFRSSERFKNLTRNTVYKVSGKLMPLSRSGLLNHNYSISFEMTNITELSKKSRFVGLWKWTKKVEEKNKVGVHLVQYFKVRPNFTLYGHFLGTWDREQSMSKVQVPYPVEARSFLGEEFLVGRCNSTAEGPAKLEDDGPSSPAHLDDTLHFLTTRLNATPSTRYFSKLGFRTYEGAWTGLLGALVDHSVDLALEPVTAHSPRHTDMDFVFPIVETMCNIYIRHQETSTVRDIFLAPFSVRLLACVISVVLVAAMAVVFVSRLAPQRYRPMDYAEALLWSTGILCQQGGNWTPVSTAGSTLLIVCLLFAVVTYNSYAAFITSVLSVRVASVDTAAAVLYSTNFKIGYIRNGADQMYLMSTKDTMLNAFYIRGYSDAENLVSTAEEGLARAAKHDYAFFAGQRAARSTLNSLSQARGRCALRELPVPSTRAQLAFPMPRGSPYSRPTLVSLLQLRTGGTLARLGASLVPSMPDCEPPKGFASARATDVRSALILLGIGLIAALTIGLGEFSWKNREKIKKSMKHFCNRAAKLLN